MIDALAQYLPGAPAYPQRVRESIANLVSYVSSHLTRSRQESVPVHQKIDLSVPVINEERFKYWRTSLDYHRWDRTRDTMTLNEFAEIAGQDAASKVRKAYENGEVHRLNRCADWGPYFVYLGFPSNGNGPGVKLTYANLRNGQKS
jgi:hypothetical protein